ncbi:MAG: hypothetical protein V4624_09915 [Pseudomonadota bacterium]
MEVTIVAAQAGRMQCDVCGHAIPVRKFTGVTDSQILPNSGIQLSRQANFDLAGEDRIAALVMEFDTIPKFAPIGCPTTGQNQLRMNNAGFPCVVVDQPGSGIHDFNRSAIGGCAGRAATSRPADRFHAEVKNRHTTPPKNMPKTRFNIL